MGQQAANPLLPSFLFQSSVNYYHLDPPCCITIQMCRMLRPSLNIEETDGRAHAHVIVTLIMASASRCRQTVHPRLMSWHVWGGQWPWAGLVTGQAEPRQMPGLHPLSISEPQQLDTHATRVEGSNLAATGKWDTPRRRRNNGTYLLAMVRNAKSFTIEKPEL
jgi:hypothetical protein